jgi:hypothetical protein
MLILLEVRFESETDQHVTDADREGAPHGARRSWGRHIITVGMRREGNS